MRAILVDIAPKDLKITSQETYDDRISELKNLVSTYDGVVILETVQKRDVPDYKTYVGSGKIDEVIAMADEMKADVIIIGNILKPSQIFNINQYIEEKRIHDSLQAWDRVDLILKIFERHAKTPESKLQIQLASIKHMGPRIYNMGMELDGIGAGETNTEVMKRHLQSHRQTILKKLEKIKKTRTQNRAGRLRKNLRTVGLVGYTNAGKSTLMNALTNKGVLQEDKLFATLGTSVARMKLEAEDYYDEHGQYKGGGDVLINDTIGFIRDLPPHLINAFTSTLEESIESSLLLHIVDASDPKIDDRISITDEILEKIGATQKKRYIFNQIDKLSTEEINVLKERFSELDPIFISAYKDIGVKELKKIIIGEL